MSDICKILQDNEIDKPIQVMKRTISKHIDHWSNKSLVISSLVGAVFFIASLVINHFATIYATEEASNYVRDVLLSNLPVFNVDIIVNEGAMIFLLFVTFLLILEPKRIPFTLKSAAVFIIIRALFITLTHVGPFPVHSYLDKHDIFQQFTRGKDFFFSGHTGLPFLMALIFWDEKWIRNISLVATAVFAISVILGHLHYSIDVFAAFFITYGIFHIAQKFFPVDFQLFQKYKRK